MLPQLNEMQRLKEENDKFRYICRELQLFAKRYADGRMSKATSTVNEITKQLLALGVELNPGGEGTLWATDGMGRSFDKLTDEQLTPNSPAALGHYLPLPRNCVLADELRKELGEDPADGLRRVLRLKELLKRCWEHGADGLSALLLREIDDTIGEQNGH